MERELQRARDQLRECPRLSFGLTAAHQADGKDVAGALVDGDVQGGVVHDTAVHVISIVDADRRKHARDRRRRQQRRSELARPEHHRLACVHVRRHNGQRNAQVLEGRHPGQRLGAVDEAANIALRHEVCRSAPQARHDHAQRMRLEHGRGLPRQPHLAQHHAAGQRRERGDRRAVESPDARADERRRRLYPGLEQSLQDPDLRRSSGSASAQNPCPAGGRKNPEGTG